MKYLLVFLSLLYQTIAWAETTTSYDFSNRTPGVNIYAYEGISGSQLPANNSFPSSQYSASSYSDIATNNNSYHNYINYSKNQFPSIRYVVKIDEDANAINKLNIFWNGYGVNSKRNQTDGVRIYIWNNNTNGYDFVTQNTNDWVVELDQDITSNVANYVDNSSQVTVYVVSQKKTFNRGSNWIGTDYFRLSVTYDDTPVPAAAIANFQFDECAYFGVGNEVVDQFGNYSGTSHNSVNTSVDAQIEKALDISSAQQHVQVNIPLQNSFSVSTWFKKPTDNSGNRYFILGAMASGGDLLYLDRNNGWRWGIYDAAAGNSINGNYSFNNLDNSWHHMALVYQNSQTKLYIDGSFIETINLAPSGTLKYIGTSFDDFGTNTPQGFRAPLDEFIVFDGALTENEILAIYNYQNSGKNYDGTSREPVQCAQLIAQFSMDESLWTGAAGEVTDETGNYNAQTINGPLTADANRAITGNPGTCGYGVFDGVDDYVELPNSFENLQDSFTITAWINPSNLDSGSRIFADDENNQTGYALSLSDQNSNNGHLRFYSRGVSPISVDTAGGVISANTWTFVSVVHNSVAKTRQIYVNGVAQALNGGSSISSYTGNWGTDTGPATIGGETDNGETNNRFTGSIDEVHVFKGALTSAEINEVYAKTHPCAEPVIHHYEIVHDGNGLTCAAEPITIKACTNSDCSSLSTESVSLDFLTTGAISGKLTKTSPTFTGSTSFNFNHTNAEKVILSIGNASVNASFPVECSGVGASCEMTFESAGFRFLYGPDELEVIPTQTSAIAINNLKLQAVKDVSGVCEGIFTGNVAVNLSQQNIQPNDNSGLSFQVNNGNIAKYPTFSSNVLLNFSNDSKAELPVAKYLDAGKIQLHASYSDGDISLAGNSNQFWVKPAKFEIAASNSGGNIEGDSVDSTTIHKAGDTFTFSVSALNGDGNKTPNYLQSDGRLQLSVERVAPIESTSVEGVFLYADSQSRTTGTLEDFQDVTLTSFSTGTRGVSTFTAAQYNEVGIFSVDISDVDYGEDGDNGLEPANVEADKVTVGRFIPSHFIQTIVVNDEAEPPTSDHGAITGKLHDSQCQSESWVYSGQMTNSKGAIRYVTPPTLTIAAFNVHGDPTKNYYGDFAKIKGLAAGVADNIISFTNASSTHMNGLPLNSDMSAIGSFTDVLEEGKGVGVVKYRLSDEHHFTYVRNSASEVAPFYATFELPIEEIQDSDDVTIGAATSYENPNFVSSEGVGVEVRFGRWFIENSYGPETSEQVVPSYSQFLKDGTFITNTDDNCSVIISSDESDRLTGLLISDGTLSSNYTELDEAVDGLLENGLSRDFILTAPGQGNVGDIKLQYTPPPWLLYDWNGDGTHDDNPTSTATFGLYRGNDRIISWREVTN